MHNVSSLKIKSAILLVMCSKSSSLISPFKKYSILIGKGPVKPRILLTVRVRGQGSRVKGKNKRSRVKGKG